MVAQVYPDGVTLLCAWSGGHSEVLDPGVPLTETEEIVIAGAIHFTYGRGEIRLCK